MRHVLIGTAAALLGLPAQAVCAQESPIVELEAECYIAEGRISGLAVKLSNAGIADTAVVLGIVLANGDLYLPHFLSANVRMPGSSQEQGFTYAHSQVPGIAGRVDPWIVPLPAGASYELQLDGAHFLLALEGKRLSEADLPVEMRLRLDADEVGHTNLDTTGLALWSVYVGNLTSKWLNAPGDCRGG